MRFATMVLAGPNNLRVTTGQLPEPVASACWRLIRLLEYLASLDDGLSPDSEAFLHCGYTIQPRMGLPEELYMAMLEVGHCARHHKIPGPLAHTMIDVAQKFIELWRQDERAATRFATMVLAGPTNLRETTGQLSKPVASACWRLIGLVEYLAYSGAIAEL